MLKILAIATAMPGIPSAGGSLALLIHALPKEKITAQNPPAPACRAGLGR